jgi:hypothetical protein
MQCEQSRSRNKSFVNAFGKHKSQTEFNNLFVGYSGTRAEVLTILLNLSGTSVNFNISDCHGKIRDFPEIVITIAIANRVNKIASLLHFVRIEK